METKPITVQGVKETIIKPVDLFMLDVKSNQMIKTYRESLGLETAENRIDTGDLKMIVMALSVMGFSVVKLDTFHDVELPDISDISDIRQMAKIQSDGTRHYDFKLAFEQGANYVIDYIKSKRK